MSAGVQGRGRRASHSVAISLVARALRAATRLGAFALAARLFPVHQVGNFAFWLSAGSFAGVIGDFGLGEHLMRRVPALGAEATPLLRAAVRIRVLGGVTIAVAIFAALVASGRRPDLGESGAFLFGAALGLADFLAAARRSRGRFDLEALESALVAGLALGAAVLVTRLAGGFREFQLVLGLGASIAVALRLVALARSEKSDAALVRPADLLAECRWLWLKAFVGWSFLDASVLMLAYLTDDSQVALFAGAARLVGLMTQPFLALSWVFTPALAHERTAGRARFLDGVVRLNRVGLLAAPAGVSFCVLLGGLALSGFGASYRSAEPALLMLALGFAVSSGVLSSVPLVVLGKERETVLLSLVGSAALFAGSLLFVPGRGANGAAAVVLAALVLTRLSMVPLYRLNGLPLGDPASAVTVTFVAAWTAAVALSEGRAHVLLLGLGGLVSAGMSLWLLHRTHIFESAT